MKNLLFLLIPILLLASCSNGPNKITSRYLAQQCDFSPLTDSVQNLIAAGFVHADASHAGNPLICDSVYTLKFNTAQQWQTGNKWFLFIGGAIVLLTIGLYVRVTTRGNDNQGLVIPLLIGICVGCSIMGGFYFFNDYRDIKKSDYAHYMQTDGNLTNWWKLPAQSY